LFFNNEGASIPEEQTHGVQAYPNPVSDNITLSTTKVPMNSIEVFGLDGTLLMEDSPNSNTYSIDLSKATTGTYLVRIFLANSTETLRIIKE
jgi:hypothetical protein